MTGLLIAWLCVNGALLDVVQVVAWGRMFADYARVLPVDEALRRTFDPGRPCAICRAVQKARAADRHETPAPVPAVKLLVFCQAAEAVILPTGVRTRIESDPLSPVSPRLAVPVPPPRRCAVA